MAFYTEIAPFYDDIFPVGDKQLAFIEKYLGKAPQEVIDIACGNGGYSVVLAEKGHLVTAIDSDGEMLVSAAEKAALAGVELATIQCSMDEINKHITGHFDLAICIGNSLVHLDTKGRVLDFLTQMHKIIKAEGTGIIQMINYNKVIKHGMTTLPMIEKPDKKLSFKRTYTLEEDKIIFNTTLAVDGKVIENSVPLLPLLKEEIEELLVQAGFKIEQVYGGYDGSPYKEAESLHYIAIVKL